MITTITTMVTTLKALGIDAPFIFQSVVTFLVLALAFGVVFIMGAIWAYKKFKGMVDSVIANVQAMFVVQAQKNEEHIDKLVEALKKLPEEVQGTKKDMTELRTLVQSIHTQVETQGREIHEIRVKLGVEPKP